MPFDSDVALVGTGVAPLIAANHLMLQGKSVIILNPDLDFFLEDSELPLDPFLPKVPTGARLLAGSPERALAELRPDYPGPIEFWAANLAKSGFHDPTAPHVRQRGRLWLTTPENGGNSSWGQLEDLYVESADLNLNPQILEGAAAARRFPGFNRFHDDLKGLFIPKLCDFDVHRYRDGLLEYMRERLGNERIVCSVTHADLIQEGIRFHAQNTSYSCKLTDGVLIFWTPRLNSWILNQAKKMEIDPVLPKGVRLWEQWSVNSREAADPSIVGIYENMAVWAESEGPAQFSPESQLFSKYDPAGSRITVLRSGPLKSPKGLYLPQFGADHWASSESFTALSRLCHQLLNWDRFSVRAMKVRTIFEWEDPQVWSILDQHPQIRIVPRCDGPLVDVVQQARNASNLILEES